MLSKRLASFKYAFKGISNLFQTQPNAQIHLIAATFAIALGIYLKLSFEEWAILSITIFAVLAAEAFNTAIEYLTDLVSPDFHPLAGKTKDVAAAGVLLTAIGAIFVAIFIFLPKIISLFSTIN
jgi:diacylglycerol kinase